MYQNKAFQHKRAIILLVDDDAGDRELTRRALQEGILRVELRTATDGQDALDYLLRRGNYTDPSASPRPDLILLDLNMPRVNGRQVLERLKDHPVLDHIPVVVLTTSNQDEDILRSYDLGCNSLIQKPVDLGRFVQIVRELGNYWFELVTLPPESETAVGSTASWKTDWPSDLRTTRRHTT